MDKPSELNNSGAVASSLRRRGRRILVVDDNVAAAKTLSLLLTSLGPHTVETVHDGPAALATAPHFRPELVLLDIGMPGMSGYDVARALRATPAGAGALLAAVTGYGQEEDRRRSREAGFDEHLVKPPSQESIVRLLHHPKLEGGAAPVPDPPSPPAAKDAASPHAAPPTALSSTAGAPPLERRLGVFLRELGHEVGNAVQPLQLLAQVLQHAALDPNLIERLRQALAVQLPSLERLLHDLRRVSLVARGAVEPQPRLLDPAPLLRQVGQNFRPRAEERGLTLVVQVPESLPAAPLDADLLAQALEELLDNALRHTAAGGSVTLAAWRQDKQLCIAVRDAGSGVPPALLPHVFELFVRGEDAAEFGWERLGIGLTLVRQIVEKHGGQVELASPGPGQGAEAIVRLPLKEEEKAVAC